MNSFPKVLSTVRQRRYVTPDRNVLSSPKEDDAADVGDASNNDLPSVSTVEPPAPDEEALDQPSSEVMDMLQEIKQTMSTSFAIAPPHTVQRLVELLQHPNDQYSSLIKYLRALQRVLSVSSTMSQSPLDEDSEIRGQGIAARAAGDDALGGALLTPIPWLKAEQDDEAPNRVNGLSQDGLLHQDYSPRHDPNHFTNHTPNGGHVEEFNHVHAQGPPTLGPEDVGPQPSGTILPALTETSEALEAIEAQTQARQDEMRDTAMTGDEDNDTSSGVPQLIGGNEDSMDIDHHINVPSSSADDVGVTLNNPDKP